MATTRESAGGRPHVAIVILNWSHPVEVLDCLASLERLRYPAWSVVVVDNASGNGSLARIRGRFPWVTLIENGRNRGFAGGNNVGIAQALRQGADYVLLLNDDTEVAPDMLQHLVAVGERERTVGVLGPTIYYHDLDGRRDVIWSAGGLVDRYGGTSHRRDGEVDQGGTEPPRDVDYVTGCAMLVKRQVIERVGALDERFFAYYEETEWCARARRAGFRVAYVPGSRVWHKIQPAQRTSSRLYLYLMTRNQLLYLRCTGAAPSAIARAVWRHLRTAFNWRYHPRYRAMRPLAGVVVRGVRDSATGRLAHLPAL